MHVNKREHYVVSQTYTIWKEETKRTGAGIGCYWFRVVRSNSTKTYISTVEQLYKSQSVKLKTTALPAQYFPT